MQEAACMHAGLMSPVSGVRACMQMACADCSGSILQALCGDSGKLSSPK